MGLGKTLQTLVAIAVSVHEETERAREEAAGAAAAGASGGGSDGGADAALPLPPPLPLANALSVVICPTTLVNHWEAEIRRFFPPSGGAAGGSESAAAGAASPSSADLPAVELLPIVYVGSPAERRAILASIFGGESGGVDAEVASVTVAPLAPAPAAAAAAAPAAAAPAAAALPARAAHRILLLSYATLRRDVQALLDAATRSRSLFFWAVADEAHTASRPGTAAAAALRALGARAAHRVALTGTPISNGVGDVWGLMDFALPG
jgi:SNF2 family DNA or RNA helicase